MTNVDNHSLSITLLSQSILLASVTWDIEPEIQHATRGAAPSACPPNCCYVPEVLRDQLITCAQITPVTGHPGVRCTYQLVAKRYWWPTMTAKVEKYVRSCAETTPRQLPAGRLHPLPVPERPWSHIAVDFMTDLPPSKGKTVIMVVVNRLLKSCVL